VITKRRSLAKSITWRLIAIAVTFIVGLRHDWQLAVRCLVVLDLKPD
jgi:hypothetical protein